MREQVSGGRAEVGRDAHAAAPSESAPRWNPRRRRRRSSRVRQSFDPKQPTFLLRGVQKCSPVQELHTERWSVKQKKVVGGDPEAVV